ncbi:FAD-dependent oxidoreductase [Flavobacteriaceae bacterium F08102]|nr:FAD-dependent oxidoreductase [Flavobacteriaceae bacterium F08102]
MNKSFDVLIIGGGASGMSCALILGSAHKKEFATTKKIGIVMHQKASHLHTAMFNNVLGLNPRTLGVDILTDGKQQLAQLYPHVQQIKGEKVCSLYKKDGQFTVVTNKNTYQATLVVIATGYTKPFLIEGLEDYVQPHPKAKKEKNRIWLKNVDHLVTDGLYVAGALAGWRSQFAIACGSGAAVATDILTLWNDGEHTKIHDKI